MTGRPLSTAEQPFRASLLCLLEPDRRRVVEAFGDLLQAALLEAFARAPHEPFNLTVSRAALQDLEALVHDTREAVETWGSSQGDTSPRLFGAMAELLVTLQNALDPLRGAVEEESRHGA